MFSSLRLLLFIPLITGCSVFGINSVDEPAYAVLQAEDHYELREYEPIVIAETFVDGDFDSAGGRAFQKLFGYISGQNSTADEIAMTAPVITDPSSSAASIEIAMTAPVMEERVQQGWRYMFVLPAEFSLENAPLPLDQTVKISAEPQKRVAVIRFSGSLDQQLINNKTDQLLEWIQARGLNPVSEPRWARYNPPWTIPLLRRNEIMIEVS